MPNSFNKLREDLRFDSAFWRKFMINGVQHLPKKFVQYSPALFGVGFGLGLPEMRKRVRASLEHVLGLRPPAQEMQDIAAVFINYAHCLTEAILVGTNRGYSVKPNIVNSEHYEACIAKNRGIIIATAHTGGWDIAGSMLRKNRNQKVFVVMARERDTGARRVQDEMREKAGVGIVHIGDSPFDALPLLRHLKENAIVAMQIDRTPVNMRARETTLLGKPWRVPEGPFRLAAASGAPILPIFTRRLGFLEYEATLHTPIHLSRRPTNEELDQAAQQLMDNLGSFLQRNATQWFDFAGADSNASRADHL